MLSKCTACLVNYPQDGWTRRCFKPQPKGFVELLFFFLASPEAYGSSQAWD